MVFPSIPGLFVYIEQAPEDLSIVNGVAAGLDHQAKQVILLGGFYIDARLIIVLMWIYVTGRCG